jgi:hypothetical protein
MMIVKKTAHWMSVRVVATDCRHRWSTLKNVNTDCKKVKAVRLSPQQVKFSGIR